VAAGSAIAKASSASQGIGTLIAFKSSNRGDEVVIMKATQLLHNLGQSIWLDNITHDLLTSGTLERYVTELSVTGLMDMIAFKSAAPRRVS
jgi:hypothetical protein